MLRLETLIRKNHFKKSENEILVDLTKSSIVYNEDPRVIQTIIVTEDFKMRPDLIALAIYGDQNKLDFILKYNGISNPFSLEVGDKLLIPDASDMQSALIYPKKDEEDQDVQKEIDTQPIDQNKADREKRKEIKEKTNNNAKLPPNVNKPGDENIKIKDGKLIFGEDITSANLDNCPETLSRSRVKEKLLKSKIFE